MATITIDQRRRTRVSQMRIAPFHVQKFLRTGFTTAERTAAMERMAPYVRRWITHWSGGIPTTEWARRDFAPDGSTPSTRSWATSGNAEGLDPWFAKAAQMRGLNPDFQVYIICHDHPGVMVTQTARDSPTSTGVLWPAPAMWDTAPNHACALFDEVYGRYNALYPGLIGGVSYGQERKGFVTNNADPAQNLAFCNGFINLATHLRNNYPQLKRLFPHLSYFGSEGMTQRKISFDELLGGGPMAAADQAQIDLLLDYTPPDLVNAWTFDVSVVDYNGTDTWHGNLAAIRTRLGIQRELMRAIRERIGEIWGPSYTGIEMIAIEAYFDVRLTSANLYNHEIQGAFHAAMNLEAMKAGVSEIFRWDPHYSSASEGYEGNNYAWWNDAGVPWPLWDMEAGIQEAIPPGTDLIEGSCDTSHVYFAASETTMAVINCGPTTESISIDGVVGEFPAFNLAPYAMEVVDLPPPPGAPPGGYQVPAIVQTKQGFNSGTGAGTVQCIPDATVTPGNVGIIFAAMNQNSADRSFATPSGWSPVDPTEYTVDNLSDMQVYCFKREFDGTANEGQPQFTPSPDVARTWFAFYELSGIDYDATVEVVLTQSSTNSASLPGGSLTALLAGSMHICCVVSKNTYVHSYTGAFTQQADGNEGGTASSQKLHGRVYDYILPGSVSAQNPTPTVPTNTVYAAIHIALQPASVGMTEQGQSLVAAAGTVAGTGSRRRGAQVAVGAAAGVTPAGGRIRKGAVTIASAGTVAAVGTEGGTVETGAVLIAATSIVAAAPAVLGAEFGRAVVAATSSLAAVGTERREVRGQAVVGSTVLVNADGFVFHNVNGQLVLGGQSGLRARGTRGRQGYSSTSLVVGGSRHTSEDS